MVMVLPHPPSPSPTRGEGVVAVTHGGQVWDSGRGYTWRLDSDLRPTCLMPGAGAAVVASQKGEVSLHDLSGPRERWRIDINARRRPEELIAGLVLSPDGGT